MTEEEKLERLEICRKLIELREQLGDIVFEEGPAPEKAEDPPPGRQP